MLGRLASAASRMKVACAMKMAAAKRGSRGTTFGYAHRTYLAAVLASASTFAAGRIGPEHLGLPVRLFHG
jgi:hypothetical protein